MIMPLPIKMKMKMNVPLSVVAVITLLFTMLLFKEVSATSSHRAIGQPNGHVPKPPPPHKSRNADSSFKAAATPGPKCDKYVPSSCAEAEKEQQVKENAAGDQPNGDVPKPPPPHKSSNVHTSFKAGAATLGAKCDKYVPSCAEAEKEQQVVENAEKTALRRNNDETYINGGAYAVADHTY